MTVDFELHGCPINKHQLLEVISAHLNRRRPRVRSHSVCVECKRRGTVCVMVANGTPCLGPVTHAGCGAICPAYDRGCYGCYGPKETPNTTSLDAWSGLEDPDLVRIYRTFNAAAPAFREASEAHEHAVGRTRTIRTDYLARIEGEAAMYVRLEGHHVREVKLRIYEPPRFFEAFLRGRAFTEAPDLTARICGICPVAYQMSAVRAMENACGVAIDDGRSATFADCSTAGSGSRATVSMSTCSTRPTSSDTQTRSRWPGTIARSSSAACR